VETRAENKTGSQSPGTGPAGDGLMIGPRSFLDIQPRSARPAVSTQLRSGLVKTIGKRAKLSLPVHAHMLRHTCGYAVANRGHDTRHIEDWLRSLERRPRTRRGRQGNRETNGREGASEEGFSVGFT